MEDVDRELDELLLLLRDTRGFDFTGYKRATLIRRVARRMAVLSLEQVTEYRDYLELEPREYAELFDSLLINVTSFFRDPSAWDDLRETVLPELIRAKEPNRQIRVWSAGCSSGEEAYTLAMLLAEQLGLDRFRDRVKIYATDLDEDALRAARAGVYNRRQVQGVPPELRERYFEESGQDFVFHRELRRKVIFGRNDLTTDAPISRVDLLVARNTLMYFTAEVQASVIRRFHFALADTGYLFLGKAEMLLNHGDRFTPVVLRKRIFRRIPGPSSPRIERPLPPRQVSSAGQLEAATFSSGPVAQLAVDLSGNLALANAQAEALFHLHPGDVGKPFQDLEISYRPVELRSAMEQVRTGLRPVHLRDVPWRRHADKTPEVYDVGVVPLYTERAELIGIGISFTDVTHSYQLQEDLRYAKENLERAYAEEQSLNEELETTNEELQSTNEELETTNEELQSTNEELETMNEELQSTNDELQEINDVLRARSEDLDTTRRLLGAVLHSMGDATAVVDAALRVTVWSQEAVDLWGLRADEAVGAELHSLDIGMPVARVAAVVRRLLAGEGGPQKLLAADAVNRRGRTVNLTVSVSLLGDREHNPRGAVLIMNLETQPDSHDAP
ncbi:MAG TPA: CheR family methyltransferase [Streptomyces sp.]|nr:CheR family methyltransferase [Streptomyces sp.]